MADLSVLIPARNEMFLGNTVEDVLGKARADTEVIAVLDGEWPDPPLLDHPKLRVTHSATVIGQRAATNLAASISRATYVMKLDAHCSVDVGFDEKLIAADHELGRPDLTQIPAMYNHHAFNWRCRACGRETYQGPTPTTCQRVTVGDKRVPSEMDVDPEPCGASAGFDRVLIWRPRRRRAQGNGSDGRGREVRSEFWRFDHELHFQYWDSFKQRPNATGDLVDTMSSIGACFFMRRARFHEVGGLDESHGSWGQFGTEIACKSWLSGGRHIVNKRTWFSHLFRTQGGDFGMPYPNPASAVAKARAHSRKLWIDGTWPGATYPLSWLLEKFAPVPDWTKEQIDATVRSIPTTLATPAGDPDAGDRDRHRRGRRQPSQGLIYYTDNRGYEGVLQTVRGQIARAAAGRPIVSATLQPVDLGRNIVLPLERGYLTMFKQILVGLEALETDIVFHVEHDVLYHPSHFDFVPSDHNTFYYNQNTWRIDATSGRALFYLCSQVSGLCAYRDILIDHYRKRVAHVEQYGFDRNLGFEPGTNRRARALDGRGAATWMSAQPNVDIKTDFCLTKGRWSQDQFRNKNSCLGWTESDRVPGWGVTQSRVEEFLADVRAGVIGHEVAA